ncbi:zinc-finger associated domain containing protein, partial [Oryctes borbonicus]
MSALNLKSNILELVCRTCLKMNRNRYNIFAHSFNNKLISDLIMECTSIKVAKNDGFPANICSNCLESLNVIDNFKTMANQCDVKLHRFYERKSMKVGIKLKNQCEDEVPIKEEGCPVKHEPIEFICDEENKSDISNNVNGTNNDPLDIQNDQIKQEHQRGDSCDDSEDSQMLSGCESTEQTSESDCSKDSCQYSTCSEFSIDESKAKTNEEKTSSCQYSTCSEFSIDESKGKANEEETLKETVKEIETSEPENDVRDIIKESD